MTLFYTREEADRWKRRADRALRLCLALGGAGLIACLLLCVQVRTVNAQPRLIAVIALSTAAGWAVILLRTLAYLPARAEQRHMEGILQGEAEEFCGAILTSPVSFPLPRSITIRKVTLRAGEESHALQVDERFLPRLPADGTQVRVTAVRRYITSVEVCHEAD